MRPQAWTCFAGKYGQLCACGSILLQQPLLCATAWLSTGPLESKDTDLYVMMWSLVFFCVPQ